jgi:hypothetical protein
MMRSKSAVLSGLMAIVQRAVSPSKVNFGASVCARATSPTDASTAHVATLTTSARIDVIMCVVLAIVFPRRATSRDPVGPTKTV